MSDKTKTAWVINGLLAAVLVLLVGHYVKLSCPSAYAAGGGWETNGIMATAFETTDRVVLIDTRETNKSIMIYRMNGHEFRLVGARSFEFDTEVEDAAGGPIEKAPQGTTWLEMYKLYTEHTAKKTP